MNHFISLAAAIEMTSLYRLQKDKVLQQQFVGKNILPLSETFDRAAFDAVLSQPGCVGLRIYYGMQQDLTIHALIVGVNDKNEDLIPARTNNATTTAETDDQIIELGQRCPDICPTESTLNS